MFTMPVPQVVYDACKAYILQLEKEREELDKNKNVVIGTYERLIKNSVERGEIPEEKEQEEIERIHSYYNSNLRFEDKQINWKIQQLLDFIRITGGDM